MKYFLVLFCNVKYKEAVISCFLIVNVRECSIFVKKLGLLLQKILITREMLFYFSWNMKKAVKGCMSALSAMKALKSCGESIMTTASTAPPQQTCDYYSCKLTVLLNLFYV